MGAAVRNVNVWCVPCAHSLCHRACLTTSHRLPTASHAVGWHDASCGACLILLATCYAVSGNRSFIDHVNDKTPVCTPLNDSLSSSGRLKRCSTQCRSRFPLTQRVCRLEVVQSSVKLRATRILAVGHCKNKSSWDVFELSQRASDLKHSPFVMEFCSLLLCKTCSSLFTLPSSCVWSLMKIEQRI